MREEEDRDSGKEWYQVVQEACKNALDNFQNENTENEKGMQYQKLSDETASQLRQVLSKV